MSALYNNKYLISILKDRIESGWRINECIRNSEVNLKDKRKPFFKIVLQGGGAVTTLELYRLRYLQVKQVERILGI